MPTAVKIECSSVLWRAAFCWQPLRQDELAALDAPIAVAARSAALLTRRATPFDECCVFSRPASPVEILMWD